MHLPRTLSLVAAAVVAWHQPVTAQASLQAEPSAVSCPDCNPPKRFWAGAAELMIVQLIPWSVSRYLRDAEWAKISFKSWSDNVKYPWQWDNNQFLNNQF